MENAAGGHRFACECGTVYQLPPAPPEGDFRICLNCTKLNEAEAIVCTGCDFNFVNNRRFTEEEPEESSGSCLQWLMPLLILVFFLGLLAGGGFWAYSSLTASKIGRTKEAPLGRYAEGKEFNQANFKPVAIKLPPKLKDCKGYLFARKKPLELSTGFDHVFLLTDPKGKILAVEGHYTETLVPATPTEIIFFDALKKEYGIPEKLEFKAAGRRQGPFGAADFECLWENDTVRYEQKYTDNPGGFGIKTMGRIFITQKTDPVTSADLSGIPKKNPF